MSDETAMGDDSPGNMIAPQGAPDGEANGAQGNGSAQADRGMPDLGQHRGGRPRAWWLTPLMVIVIVLTGAVWTVHGFLARHDAQAKARRDAALDQPAQGRIFGDEPASAAPAASAPASTAAGISASSARAAAVPATAAAPPSPAATRVAPARSYYDAPVIATGGTDGPAAGATSFATTSASGATPAPASPGTARTDSPLGRMLTPVATPRVMASRLGDRNLILAQGAKIDCAGDTAFDSSEAGISTCTVTRNVYSDNGRVVLIERGAEINSEYRSNLSAGQKRVFILSARVRTPNGVTVEIDSPAADALGRMGIGGDVNSHWGERVGAAFLLSLTQDAIGYLATRGGNSNSPTVFENTQQRGNDMAARVLDSTINIPPTLTQNQGAEFTIVVARDLDFSSVYALEPESVR